MKNSPKKGILSNLERMNSIKPNSLKKKETNNNVNKAKGGIRLTNKTGNKKKTEKCIFIAAIITTVHITFFPRNNCEKAYKKREVATPCFINSVT